MTNIQLSHQHHKPKSVSYKLCLLANDLSDPRNCGSLFRLADAFAIEKLYLCGDTPTPPNNKIHKASRHTDKLVPFEYSNNATSIIDELKNNNVLIIALEITNQSIRLKDLTIFPSQPVCLIIGSENHGIPPDLLTLADITTHIPMYGKNSSMNVATATAIALHEISNKLIPLI